MEGKLSYFRTCRRSSAACTTTTTTPDVDNTQKIEKNINVNKGNNIDHVDNVDKGLIKEKYRGKPYIHLKRKPKFVLTKSRYKSYSAHDSLGRCGVAEE